VLRNPHLLELQQPYLEQRSELELARLQRLREEARRLPLEPLMPAQCAVHERAEQRPVALRDAVLGGS